MPVVLIWDRMHRTHVACIIIMRRPVILRVVIVRQETLLLRLWVIQLLELDIFLFHTATRRVLPRWHHGQRIFIVFRSYHRRTLAGRIEGRRLRPSPVTAMHSVLRRRRTLVLWVWLEHRLRRRRGLLVVAIIPVLSSW